MAITNLAIKVSVRIYSNKHKIKVYLTFFYFRYKVIQMKYLNNKKETLFMVKNDNKKMGTPLVGLVFLNFHHF